MAYEDMAVFIENLGVYNEGGSSGAWFTFPIDESEVAERIGLNKYYEEYAIHATENIPCKIKEYTSIQELNHIYETIQDFPEEIVDKLDDFISYFGGLDELAENLDRVYCYYGCDTMEDVARYCVEERDALGEIPPYLQDYIDYEAYGVTWRLRDILLKQVMEFVKFQDRAGRSATILLLLTAYFHLRGQ